MFDLADAPGRSGVMLIDAWRKFLQMHGAEQERLEHEVVKLGDTPNLAQARNKAWRDRVGGDWGLVEWVAWTCRQHKVDRLLIESEKGGIVVGDELRRLYGREQWEVQMVVVKGDKVSRALAVQPIFAQGIVYAPVHLDWAAMVVDEMAVFPKGRYRDLTDSATQAMKHVREHDLAQFAAEHKAAELDRMMYKGRQPKGPVEFIFGID
jgi:predicted phage terminase large subunit-like protein